MTRRWLAAAMLMTLAACGGTDQANDAAAAADLARHADDGRSVEKMNAYVEGYNALISTFGLEAQQQKYQGQQIERKSVGEPVFVQVGWIENGWKDVRKGRAAPGALPAIDAAADRLLPVLERLVGRLKGLESYY